MSYLTENIKVLLWKNKGELSNKTYCEYINHVAQQCHMDPDYFRAILRDTVQPTGREVNLLRKYFEDYGYDLSAIQYRFLFEELLAKSGDDLLAKNIQYLLKSLTRGKKAKFIETTVLIQSTVSRWKQGNYKTRQRFAKQNLSVFWISGCANSAEFFPVSGIRTSVHRTTEATVQGTDKLNGS